MRWFALCGALAIACGGGSASTKPKGPKLPDVDEKKAQRDAAGLVEEIYQTLGRGNKDSLYTLLDKELITFGPNKKDVMPTREQALTALGELVDPKTKKTMSLSSGALEVVPSPGGRSAWAFDVLNVSGEPIAVMAILTNIDDIWQVEVATLAYTPTGKTIKSENKKSAVVPPGSSGAKRVEDEARGAVERFRKGLTNQTMWGADLGSRSDAMVVGPALGEVTRGKKEIKKLWKMREDAKTRAVTNGDITAAVTDDGQLAWVTAPITRVDDGDEPLPLRAFAVFEKSGDSWKLIALHESVAIDEPGAAKEMKKVLPPKPDEDKPDEDKLDKKKKKTDPKKKKKKKKKPVDDE